MHLGVLHTLFDLAMGAVLLHWAGRKLADLSRHDTVSVVWECMMSEVRRLRAQPEPERARKLTTPAQSYR